MSFNHFLAFYTPGGGAAADYGPHESKIVMDLKRIYCLLNLSEQGEGGGGGVVRKRRNL